MTKQQLLNEVLSLPIEDRAHIADILLKSLNPPNTEVDSVWLAVAEKRWSEIQADRVKPIPGDQVFDRMHNRLSKS